MEFFLVEFLILHTNVKIYRMNNYSLDILNNQSSIKISKQWIIRELSQQILI